MPKMNLGWALRMKELWCSKEAEVGTPAADYFKIENDVVFEIGLTPNRADAASHVGVARDIKAVLANVEFIQENLTISRFAEIAVR